MSKAQSGLPYNELSMPTTYERLTSQQGIMHEEKNNSIEGTFLDEKAYNI